MRPPENLRTMYVRPSELTAIEEIVADYLHILTVTRAPQECAPLSAQLQSFRQRCLDALDALHAGCETDQPKSKVDFVPIHLPSWEILAFGTATLGYVQFWRHDLGPERRALITRVLAAQARYTGSLSLRPLPLHSRLYGEGHNDANWPEVRRW